MYVHWLIWFAALWAVTFPGATWCMALLFRRGRVVGYSAPGEAADRIFTRDIV
jgi:hypothetical protein